MAGSILCVVQTATGPPASALDRHFELTNNTRMTIIEVYAAPVGTGRWRQDLLGDEILPPGKSVVVELIGVASSCRFDFETVFDDGSTLIRRDINVCDVQRYAISYR